MTASTEHSVLRAWSETVDFRLTAPLEIGDFWPMRAEISETLRAKLAALSPPRAASLAAEILEGPFFASGRMDFPAQVVVVSGESSATVPA